LKSSWAAIGLQLGLKLLHLEKACLTLRVSHVGSAIGRRFLVQTGVHKARHGGHMHAEAQTAGIRTALASTVSVGRRRALRNIVTPSASVTEFVAHDVIAVRATSLLRRLHEHNWR